MLPSETMIWQPEFTDKTLSRKPGAVQSVSKQDFIVISSPPGP
ncbi:transposase [Escherichia marmotae]|nr:transposase [Escherichia marmotae]PGF87733.1 transposase [Escherichia marmotae]